jgi:DNA-binding NarL/FixJ family response regulator
MVARGLANALGQYDDIEVVGAAKSMTEGMALTQEFEPDVMLLEHQRQARDVVNVIETVRRTTPSTAILVVSAHVDERVAARVLGAGACGAIDKAQDLPALAAAIRACAAGEKLVVDPALLPGTLRLMRDSPTTMSRHLAPRERDVLTLLDRGFDVGGIASQLGITRNTARNYVQAVLTKLGAHSRLEALAIARREGLLPGHH